MRSRTNCRSGDLRKQNRSFRDPNICKAAIFLFPGIFPSPVVFLRYVSSMMTPVTAVGVGTLRRFLLSFHPKRFFGASPTQPMTSRDSIPPGHPLRRPSAKFSRERRRLKCIERCLLKALERRCQYPNLTSLRSPTRA